jgi:hypothetical protein
MTGRQAGAVTDRQPAGVWRPDGIRWRRQITAVPLGGRWRAAGAGRGFGAGSRRARRWSARVALRCVFVRALPRKMEMRRGGERRHSSTTGRGQKQCTRKTRGGGRGNGVVWWARAGRRAIIVASAAGEWSDHLLCPETRTNGRAASASAPSVSCYLLNIRLEVSPALN